MKCLVKKNTKFGDYFSKGVYKQNSEISNNDGKSHGESRSSNSSNRSRRPSAEIRGLYGDFDVNRSSNSSNSSSLSSRSRRPSAGIRE